MERRLARLCKGAGRKANADVVRAGDPGAPGARFALLRIPSAGANRVRFNGCVSAALHRRGRRPERSDGLYRIRPPEELPVA